MIAALILGYGQEADGTIDAQTQDRCNQAVRLYQRQKISHIFLTVSASKNGVRMAQAMKDYLIERGVLPEEIVIQPEGGNTAGEIEVFVRAVLKFLDQNTFFADVPLAISSADVRWPKHVLISTWYHIPRVFWLALWQFGWLAWRDFSVSTAWKHTHWADLKIEPFKLFNALLRPRRSAKLVCNPTT